ncbi:hypothetical protein XENTR_v10010544 [Xenopus tropicalis]|nr:hypothetical protein XENTR_v10010544 [Xenopus tropicalis]
MIVGAQERGLLPIPRVPLSWLGPFIQFAISLTDPPEVSLRAERDHMGGISAVSLAECGSQVQPITVCLCWSDPHLNPTIACYCI